MSVEGQKHACNRSLFQISARSMSDRYVDRWVTKFFAPAAEGDEGGRQY